MLNELLCFFKGHKLVHIANWRDVIGGRGLWQCALCKKLHMGAPSEFYDKRERKAPVI